MNKKLLTAVVGAALAVPTLSFADSANVNISGFFRVAVSQYKISQGNAATAVAGGYHAETRVDDGLSGFILSGDEDLGGGTKAWFQVETRFAPDSGTASPLTGLAYGNTGVGLKGGFGKLTIGRWNLHFWDFIESGIEPLRASTLVGMTSIGLMSEVGGSNSAVIGVSSRYIAVGTRTDNLVMWDSPNWGGLDARLAYSQNAKGAEGSGRGADGSKDGAMNARVRFSAAGVSVGASYWDWKAEGTTAVNDQKSIRAWVGYAFPFGLKVALGYDNSQIRLLNEGDAFTKRSAWMVPVSYTFGNEVIFATYAKANKLSGPNAGATTDDTGANQVTVGWDHALSKRTKVGLSWTRIDNDKNAFYNGYGPHVGAAAAPIAGTAAQAGESATQLMFGMMHSF